jgi:hypothetical protein
LLAQQGSNLHEAENCYHTARQIAIQQGARMLEQRAVTSLRLLQR